MPALIAVTHHKTGKTIHVPPVQLAGLKAAGWFAADTTVGTVEVTEPAPMPTKAAELVEWIGTDPDRAARALEVEQSRPHVRRTVVDHIEPLIPDTTPESESESEEDL